MVVFDSSHSRVVVLPVTGVVSSLKLPMELSRLNNPNSSFSKARKVAKPTRFPLVPHEGQIKLVLDIAPADTVPFLLASIVYWLSSLYYRP